MRKFIETIQKHAIVNSLWKIKRFHSSILCLFVVGFRKTRKLTPETKKESQIAFIGFFCFVQLYRTRQILFSLSLSGCIFHCFCSPFVLMRLLLVVLYIFVLCPMCNSACSPMLIKMEIPPKIITIMEATMIFTFDWGSSIFLIQLH